MKRRFANYINGNMQILHLDEEFFKGELCFIDIEDERNDEEYSIPTSSVKKIATPIKAEHMDEVVKKINDAGEFSPASIY